MFNIIMNMPHIFLVTFFSFFIFFLIRHAFFKLNGAILLFHSSLFLVLFITLIGGGGVQNAGYERLKVFMEWEKNKQLQDAKNNLKQYESILAIELKQFTNSDAFKEYLKKHDDVVDKVDAAFVAWIFVFLSDIAMVIIFIICNRENKKKV